MGCAEAQLAVDKLVAILESEQIPYAIIGGLALNEYGHRRVTVNVNLVMRDDHLREFKAKYIGNGYAERAAGTGKLLDTALNVHVDVLSTGRYPGLRDDDLVDSLQMEWQTTGSEHEQTNTKNGYRRIQSQRGSTLPAG